MSGYALLALYALVIVVGALAVGKKEGGRER